jgi:hypothetical protein
MFTCPVDPTHQSTTADMCSVCGSIIDAAPVSSASQPSRSSSASPPPAAASAVGAAQVPDAAGDHCFHCGIEKVPGDQFCPNCGTDYITGQLAVPPVDPAATAVLADSVVPGGSGAVAGSAGGGASTGAAAVVGMPDSKGGNTPGTTASAPALRPMFAAVVSIDLGPRERPLDEPEPTDLSEHIFVLDQPIVPFGRTSAVMPLRVDHGVSRAHGEFVRQSDGSFMVHDVGSSNGTALNGVALHGQELKPVKAGDTITIGFWTVITLTQR